MKQLRVKVLTTNNLQISGELRITMPLNSDRVKISDLLNNSRSFIELTDVEVYGHDQQLLAKMPFLCINKPAIACLFEKEIAQTSGGTPTSATLSHSGSQERKLTICCCQ
jgi:hypothetical protein